MIAKNRELWNKLLSVTDHSETQQPPNEETELPDLSCVYASWNNPEQKLVDCARLLSKKGKIITMRYEACQKCFARRTFVKEHKQPSETPQGDDFSRAYGKGTRDYYDSQPLQFQCPRHWNRSKCSQYPCERRPQCKQEGIIA